MVHILGMQIQMQLRVSLMVRRSFTTIRGIMPVYRDYEIRINLNELIEKRIPTCNLLHKDHCFTEAQVAEIAHDINMELDLHPIFHQVDEHIMNYVKAAGIDNTEHWVEPHLPDLEE